MKRYRVVATTSARRQIRTIATWWRENRTAHPSLFLEELADATALLAAVPMAGTAYIAPDVQGVRRLVLLRTQYHVYYSVDTSARVVRLMAVHHTARGSGPAL